jgi:transcriptional regulator with GAF, ATPase, and Fis domain
MTEDRGLAARFAELSGDLLSDPDEAVTFGRVAEKAVETIPGCTMAGIMLRRRRGRVQTVAATHDTVERLDSLQASLGEGPCLDAAFDRENCVIHDLGRDARYSRWERAAAELGIRSSMAIRLHTERETLGALNLYADRPGAFDAETADVALIYASHATEAMSKARIISGLQAALESRHLIGMAQGVLAVRYDISYERAFGVPHRFSNDNNVKLRAVAQLVLEMRALPGGDRAPSPGAADGS